MNSTGCKILDDAGVSIGDTYKRIDLCENCPFPDGCIVKSNDDDLIERPKPQIEREVYLRCKKCGATETLTITDGRLQKTSKWLQKGDTIYHTLVCGIAEEIRG